MERVLFDAEQAKGVKYAFGHLAGAEAWAGDPHAGDSRDLAEDTFEQLGLSPREVALLELAAEWYAALVAGADTFLAGHPVP